MTPPLRLAALGRDARQRVKQALRPWARRWGGKRADLPLATWRLVRGDDGELALDGVRLGDLLHRFGSPVHVVDAVRLRDNARRFTASPAASVGGCETYASYKTNPVPGVLRLLHASGLGAEVVSPYELWLALRLGVPPAAIVYNGPAKSEESLGEALRREIRLVNVNCRSELAPLAALARRLGKRPRVGVRVVVPGTWGGQFGETVADGAALRAFEEACSYPELRVEAVHAHLGGEIATRAQVEAFVTAVLDFAQELRARLGLELGVLDLGGNLACPSVSHLSRLDRQLAVTLGREPVPRSPAAVLPIEEYVAAVAALVQDRYAATGRPPPRVFLEPGRSVTGNAQLLLCRVLQVRDPDPTGMTWAVLDAGVNVAEAVRTEFHQLLPLAIRAGATRPYRLAGPSCMQGDLLFPAWELPPLAPGDGLAIMDSGAYFVPFSTDFSFPRPAVVAVDGGVAAVLRRAEAFGDLVSLDAEREAP